MFCRVTTASFIIAILSLVTQTSQATDWTNYLAGNDRAGATSATLNNQLSLAWTYHSQAKPELAFSPPRATPIEGHVMLPRVNFDASPQLIVVDNRVYFGSTVDHRLHCRDAITGKPLWSFYCDGPIRLAPTYAHGNIYFGADDGVVYCLNALDGQLKWKLRVGPKDDRLLSRGEMISRWPIRTGVLVDGDRAYFGAGVFPHETIFLAAANAITGELVWKNDRISQSDAGRNELSPQGYLLANEKHLFVPSGGSLPVAVDKQSGEIVFQKKYSWRTEAGGVVGGTKALLGDGQVFAGGPHHFLAMNESDGSLGEAYIGGRQMVLSEDRAFLVDGTNIFCVDRAEHVSASREKQKWFLRAREAKGDPKLIDEANQKMSEYAKVGVLWQTPCTLDGAMIATSNLVIAGGENFVAAYDRSSGEKVWEAKIQGRAMGLAATDQLLLVSTDQGLVYAFSNTLVSNPPNWPEPYRDTFPKDDWSDYYARAAREMLELSGHRTGYCLVLGIDDGRLAYELAKQSDLMILVVEPDAEKAARAQSALELAGLHATEVTLVTADFDKIPFSNYFANLIVSETHCRSGALPIATDKIARFLKPCGGVAMFGKATGASAAVGVNQVAQQLVNSLYQLDEGEVIRKGDWLMLRRGKLPGVGDWTHQYGNVANTSFSNDKRIRDGLGVLWYGDPGPSAMINRHEAAGAPLSTNGRMFIQGTDKVMAYDAYNGNFLWEMANPGAIRTGVFNNRETHNLAAADDVLYMAINDSCKALDAATGKVLAEYRTPPSQDGIDRAWAFVAVDDNQVFGSSTLREELEEKMRRRGLTIKSQTDAIFAFDNKTGEMQWMYRGENLLHTTIAIGPDHLYFIESSLTPEERQSLYRSDKGELKNLTGEAALKAEAEMKQLDARRAVALDRRSGKKVWEMPVDVTDTTNVSAGGGNLTVMYADGRLLLCGANANGHYWKQFLAGEFEKRKLLVLDAKSGVQLWSHNANYMNRPAVIEGRVIAEPWAFDLESGKPLKTPHLLTGEDSDWRFSRPGHHCGIVTATPNMMFFRSGFIGYYDLYQDTGTKHFAGQRLGCWVNAIPGNGLVMIPEASAGCVCQFSIVSTVVLEPKTESSSWGIFSAVGEKTPVRRIGINLGAPGDRRDAARQPWLGFPRPHSVERLEFVFDIKPQFAEGGGWYSNNPDSVSSGSGLPGWLISSGARGLKSCDIPLLGEKDKPASYDLTLHFSQMAANEVKQLSIRLQGNEIARNEQMSVSELAGDIVTLRVKKVLVKSDMSLEIESPPGAPLSSIVAIEVVKSED
jgi:outer membrane protein assembly factor BamB